MSSTLFEIGVPVRHQWCLAVSFMIAKFCRVLRERMMCARDPSVQTPRDHWHPQHTFVKDDPEPGNPVKDVS